VDTERDERANQLNEINFDEDEMSSSVTLNDILVRYENLGQQLKANPIDSVGTLIALGKDERSDL
jgi:hypothetical protein